MKANFGLVQCSQFKSHIRSMCSVFLHETNYFSQYWPLVYSIIMITTVVFHCFELKKERWVYLNFLCSELKKKEKKKNGECNEIFLSLNWKKKEKKNSEYNLKIFQCAELKKRKNSEHNLKKFHWFKLKKQTVSII